MLQILYHSFSHEVLFSWGFSATSIEFVLKILYHSFSHEVLFSGGFSAASNWFVLQILYHSFSHKIFIPHWKIRIVRAMELQFNLYLFEIFWTIRDIGFHRFCITALAMKYFFSGVFSVTSNECVLQILFFFTTSSTFSVRFISH